jgi:hypothetical protein
VPFSIRLVIARAHPRSVGCWTACPRVDRRFVPSEAAAFDRNDSGGRLEVGQDTGAPPRARDASVFRRGLSFPTGGAALTRVAIFTDNDFDKINGVTTTLKAVLGFANGALEPRIYTAADIAVDTASYYAIGSAGVGLLVRRNLQLGECLRELLEQPGRRC